MILKKEHIPDVITRYRVDLSIILLLTLIAGFGSYLFARQLDPVIVSSFGLDFWFHSDTARVFWNMSDPSSDHNRATVHPLFSLLTTPLVLGLCQLLDTDRLTAVRLVVAGAAALWSGMLYVLLRLLGLLRSDALLFCCLALVSSASIFWFTVPETFSFGSLSILFALILLARTKKSPPGEGVFLLAIIGTLSFTVTNWMVGLLSSFLSLPVKKAVRCNVIALLIVSFFSYIQRYFFIRIPFFIGKNQGLASSADDISFLFMEETGGPIRILVSFFFHSMVMPGIEYADKINRTDWELLTVQHSLSWSGSLVGTITLLSWLALLLIGFWSLYRMKRDRKIRLGIGLALLGQLGLHLIYGDETFLYSLHFLPLLIIIASYGTLSGLRKIVLALAVIACLGAAVNNVTQFYWAVDRVDTHFQSKFN